ncbi:Crp/Fnr family transcriptional regulator [Paenibacillus senegalimassiliensis]|uniref:Crp/Fnr family transcriptional regulator n=1 Tax=Paenibacillus senegalimassiliensis TaxID=1737426 RepID=UPI00073E9E5B|nr:Crp/Fnr family transcriptional regulator [Paenibacillus senegalimassiliensis]
MLELQHSARDARMNPASANTSYPDNSVNELHRKHGTLRHFPKGSFVFTKGSVSTGSYYIESGLLKVCQFTEEGRDVTFFIRKTGDAFGLAEIILQQNHPCYAQCLHDSQIWVLESSIIREQILTNPAVTQTILYTLTHRLIHHQSTVELLISKPVAWRLAWLLQQLGTLASSGELRVELDLSHEEISNIIGCTRQTVSELLSRWKQQGWIRYDRKQILIQNLTPIIGEPS